MAVGDYFMSFSFTLNIYNVIKSYLSVPAIEDKYKDWKDFLVKRLTGARTLPSNFYSKVHDSLRSRFR